MILEQKNIPFLDITRVEIIFDPGGAVILGWTQVLPKGLLFLADMACHIESAMKRYTG